VPLEIDPGRRLRLVRRVRRSRLDPEAKGPDKRKKSSKEKKIDPTVKILKKDNILRIDRNLEHHVLDLHDVLHIRAPRQAATCPLRPVKPEVPDEEELQVAGGARSATDSCSGTMVPVRTR